MSQPQVVHAGARTPVEFIRTWYAGTIIRTREWSNNMRSGIIIVGLFNVMLFETEAETLFVLWVGSVHTRYYGHTSARSCRTEPAPLSANNNNTIMYLTR